MTLRGESGRFRCRAADTQVFTSNGLPTTCPVARSVALVRDRVAVFVVRLRAVVHLRSGGAATSATQQQRRTRRALASGVKRAAR